MRGGSGVNIGAVLVTVRSSKCSFLRPAESVRRSLQEWTLTVVKSVNGGVAVSNPVFISKLSQGSVGAVRAIDTFVGSSSLMTHVGRIA